MRSPRPALPILAACAVALGCTSGAAAPAPDAAAAGEHVVLLHGLGRGDGSMRPLARRLEAEGYAVHNLEYRSRSATPEEIVAELHSSIERCCAGARRLHFVTHSLGGILARAYIAGHAPANLGRVVMLAPPNRGSPYVDIAERWSLASWLGPTGAQLGTSDESLPNRLPDPDFELGVIAGNGGFHPLGDWVLEGENDGTVSVESTRLPGVRDFAVESVSHTFIMRDDRVAAHVLAFLREGRFASAP